VFSSTDQPPAWALVRYLVAGVACSAALPHFKATLLSTLAGAIVAAAASGGASRGAWPSPQPAGASS
jgi:hypothetical protein